MSTSSKIDILKEIQKELEIRKSWKPFFLEEYLTIELDVSNNVLHANWKGAQSESTVKTGCEKILDGMTQFKCGKVLNDITHVTGKWTPAARWVADDWFPRMKIAGLKKFAWVCAPSVFQQNETKDVLRLIRQPDMLKTFDNAQPAMQWLSTSGSE